jgi:Tol biopolymer transport system component
VSGLRSLPSSAVRAVGVLAPLSLLALVASLGMNNANAGAERFVYEASTGGTSDIFVFDSGTDLSTRIGHSTQNEYSPALSPNGETVAFVRLVDAGDPGDSDIFTVAKDGSGLRRVTSGPGTDGDPAWSPDGRWISFWRDNGSGQPEIFIASVDGGSELQLTKNEYVDVQPSWSPDGSTIAFTRNVGGTTELFLVDVASGAEHRLNAGGTYALPAWSPDGTQIVGVRESELQQSNNLSPPLSRHELVTIDPKTGETRVLLDDIGTAVMSLGWRESGILYSATPDMVELQSRVVDPDTGEAAMIPTPEGGIPNW